MTTRLTVTMTTSVTDGSTQRSECQAMCDSLQRLIQVLGGSHKQSGTVNDRNGYGTLTYTYTPTASA